MEGWIKLHRTLLEWEWWHDHNATRVYVYCLLRANHKKGYYMGYEIPAGSFTSTLPKLAEATSLTVKQIRTALDKLNHTNHINSTGRAVKIKDGKLAKPRQFTVFQVVGWEKFQDERADQGQTKGRPGADQGQTKGRHNKNEKNDKNDKKAIGQDEFENLNEVFRNNPEPELNQIGLLIADAPDQPLNIYPDDIANIRKFIPKFYDTIRQTQNLDKNQKPLPGQCAEAMSLIYQNMPEYHRQNWSFEYAARHWQRIVNETKQQNDKANRKRNADAEYWQSIGIDPDTV